MKQFLLILFTSVCAKAAPLPELIGAYHFAALAVTQTQHLISVRAQSEEARNFVADLRQSNYACVAGPSLTYNCKKLNPQISEDSEIRQRLLSEFSILQLQFLAPTSDFALVNEGDSLQEFERQQPVQFSGKIFQKVHLYLTPGFTKIRLLDSPQANDEYFYMVNDNMAEQIVESRRNSPAKSFVVSDTHLFVYEVLFTKNL